MTVNRINVSKISRVTGKGWSVHWVAWLPGQPQVFGFGRHKKDAIGDLVMELIEVVEMPREQYVVTTTTF